MQNKKIKTPHKIIKNTFKKVKTPVEVFKNGFNLFCSTYL